MIMIIVLKYDVDDVMPPLYCDVEVPLLQPTFSFHTGFPLACTVLVRAMLPTMCFPFGRTSIVAKSAKQLAAGKSRAQ